MTTKEPTMRELLRDTRFEEFWAGGGYQFSERALLLLCALAIQRMTYKELSAAVGGRWPPKDLRRTVSRIEKDYRYRSGRPSGQNKLLGRRVPDTRESLEPDPATLDALSDRTLRRELLLFCKVTPTGIHQTIRFVKYEILRCLTVGLARADKGALSLLDEDWDIVEAILQEERDIGVASEAYHALSWHPNFQNHVPALQEFLRSQQRRFGSYRREVETPLEATPLIPPPLPAERALRLRPAADALRESMSDPNPLVQTAAGYLLETQAVGKEIVDDYRLLRDRLHLGLDRTVWRDTAGERATLYTMTALSRILEAANKNDPDRMLGDSPMVIRRMLSTDANRAVLFECVARYSGFPSLEPIVLRLLRECRLLTEN